MKSLKIAERDLGKLLKNRRFRLSLVVITIIPLLYSLLYLDAFWDPYSRLANVPIAVVNEDVGVENIGHVNYGDNIINDLKENHDIGWTFTSYAEAYKSVTEPGGYYAMIVIPKNFSENVMSAKNGTPVQTSLTFIENQKKNFIQTQINGKLLLELKSKIAKSITEEYTTVTFDNLTTIKDGMSDAADGSKELTDALVTAQDGSVKLNDGLTLAQAGANTLSEGVSQLATGSQTAVDGAVQINAGVNQFINQAILPVSKGITDLNTGFQLQILPSVEKLMNGSKTLADGLFSASDAAGKLSAGATSLSGATTMQGGLIDGASQLVKSSATLTAGASQLSSATTSIVTGITNLESGANAVSKGLSTYTQNVAASQKGLETATNQYLNAYLAKNPTAMTDPDMQKFIGALKQLSSASSVPENVKQINTLVSGASSVATGVTALKTGTSEFSKGITAYATGATAYATGAEKFGAGANQFSLGAGNFATGATQLANGVSAAVTGSQALAAGSAQLYAGLNTNFNAGLSKLSQSMPTVEASANKLSEATASLSTGLGTLNDGVGKLSAGTADLTEGINKLQSGSTDLVDGMTQITDGSQELNQKLTDGYNELNTSLINDSKTMSTFIADPLRIDETKLNKVDNYGKGFTPYFIALALWVGAILIFFIVSDNVDGDIKSNPISYVIGKFLTYCVVGAIQAVVVSIVVLNLGLNPTNVTLFFFTNILMSFVFIAIVQFLIYTFKDAGRILAMALLIMQLTSCAGTFPLEVVPKFFKVLNPFMPFTYTVSALREVISGIDYAVLEHDYFIFGALLIGSLILTIVFKFINGEPQGSTQKNKKEKEQELEPSYDMM